jgi:uncharacterized protein (DUF58 family)
MLDRFLDPKVLSEISGLELLAKTVVDGFIAGMHRSPDFGFSQEFAEYRAYAEGDDLRHVDWNVFARTERCYLKRYKGETNTQLTVLLDASASMEFTSHGVKKMDYARFLAASLCYMANQQRDAAGMIVFDDDVRNYVAPSTRQGQFHRLLHAIENAEPASRTDFARPFLHLLEFQWRRGVICCISDFYEDPDKVIRVVASLRHKGSDLVLFHVLDPEEITPSLRQPALLLDMETHDAIEVSPEYLRTEYREKMQAHIDAMGSKARSAGIDYFLLRTDRPLDGALREYLFIRQGKL